VEKGLPHPAANRLSNTLSSSDLAKNAALKSFAFQNEQTIVYWIYQLTKLIHSHIVSTEADIRSTTILDDVTQQSK